MRASRWSSLIAWSVCLLLLMASTRVVAQEKAEPAAAGPAEATAAAPADAAAPPVLPDYFTGGNPKDPTTGKEIQKWPDPTGGAAGAWATPSGAPNPDGTPAGDVPE